MPNYFLTRKFGRLTFGITIMLFYILVYTIAFLIFGFVDPLNMIVAILGNLVMIIITEFVSNWSYKLFNDLLEKNIIVWLQKVVK